MKTVKSLCALLIFLTSNVSSYAQLKWGLTTGLNSCIVNYSELSYNEYTGLNRPFFGITGAYSLNDRLNLIGSIRYSRIAFNRQVVFTSADSIDYFKEINQLTNYLEIPLLAQVKLSPIFRIGLGVQARWAMGAREKGFENTKSAESGYIENTFDRASKSYSKLDFGPNARVQIDMNDRWSCEICYTHSLVNYFKNGDSINKAKLRTFELGMTRFF